MFGFVDREMVVIKSVSGSATLYIIGMVKEKGLGKLLMIISGCRLVILLYQHHIILSVKSTESLIVEKAILIRRVPEI